MLSFNQSSPSYDIVCPGDTLVFTCITSYQEGIFVAWRINTQTRILHNDYKTDQTNNFGILLTITNITNNTITSTASVNVSAPFHLNGTVISCSRSSSNFINTLTVHIAGKIHNEPYVT